MGFSAEWLSLREPADRSARDQSLARQAIAAAGPKPIIVDLGCGTGATRRALAPHLPPNAQWYLVDSDPALLKVAANAGGEVETIEADIRDIDALPLDCATLITASALLDLVSERWLLQLIDRLGVPFYAALNYSGEMYWTPRDERDQSITQDFNRHQQGDKGFGPALGPHAGERSAQLLTAAGFEVQTASSPWVLGTESFQLQCELNDGIAGAANEAGHPGAVAWGEYRRMTAHESRCEIGHIDLLAIPRSANVTANNRAC